MKTTFTALLALAAVAHGSKQAKQEASKGAKLQGNGTAAVGQGAQAGPSADACAAGAILAMGINVNIADQKMELQAVGNVQKALQANDANAFAQAKATLLQFVQNGIAIRQANQAIAPPGNPAIAGLDIVANAQLTELGLANNLTGNAATDNAILQELTKDFTGGIEQNQKNAAAATQGCPNNGAANGAANGAKAGAADAAKAGADKNKDAAKAGADKNKDGAKAGAADAAKAGADKNKDAAKAGADKNKDGAKAGAADAAKAGADKNKDAAKAGADKNKDGAKAGAADAAKAGADKNKDAAKAGAADEAKAGADKDKDAAKAGANDAAKAGAAEKKVDAAKAGANDKAASKIVNLEEDLEDDEEEPARPVRRFVQW